MAKKHCGQASSLGLVCFGVTTTIIMFNGLHPEYGGKSFVQLMCWLGGYLQVIAGVLQLYREDCFSGTAFAAYGAFWVANANGAGSATFLLAFGLLTLGFAVLSLRHSPAVIALFWMLMVAFFILGFAHGPPLNEGLSRGGHWVGFWVGLLAIYIAFSPLFESTYGSALPLCHEVPEWFPCWWRYRRGAAVAKAKAIPSTSSAASLVTGEPVLEEDAEGQQGAAAAAATFPATLPATTPTSLAPTQNPDHEMGIAYRT